MEYLVCFKNEETPLKINANRVTHDKHGVFLFLAGDGDGEPVAAIPLDNRVVHSRSKRTGRQLIRNGGGGSSYAGKTRPPPGRCTTRRLAINATSPRARSPTIR